MSSNPSVLTSLMPGANIGGSSVAVPPVPGSTGMNPVIGGNTNPFLPMASTTGSMMPPMTSTSPGSGALPMGTPASGTPMPANGPGGTPGSTGLGGSNPYQLWNPFSGGQSQQGLQYAFKQAGIPGGIAALLAEFLRSGAGFNPQVMQAMFNAMQPQVERGSENIMEQFSAMGNRFGSPAAVGLGDYESQVNLNMDQIMSQMYETSVQDYLTVLMGAGKKQQSGGIMGILSQLASFAQTGSNIANPPGG